MPKKVVATVADVPVKEPKKVLNKKPVKRVPDDAVPVKVVPDVKVAGVHAPEIVVEKVKTPKVKKERTPEQIEKDKAKMAKLRELKKKKVE